MLWLGYVVLAVAAGTAVSSCVEEAAETDAAPRHRRGTLIWEERFDRFDLSRWTHLVTAWRGGNDEFQYYRNNRKNSFVENGVLHIKPTFVSDEVSQATMENGNLRESSCNREPCASEASGGEIVAPMYSARIMTNRSFGFKYGRVEVRAKMPRGDWLWPAIWFLPVNDNEYGGWPAGGEIDLVEVRSNRNYHDPNGASQGVDRFGMTLHYGPRWPFNGWELAHWEKQLQGEDFSDKFHDYVLEWTNSSITYYLDGEKLGHISPPDGFWKWAGFDKNPGGENPWAKGNRMAPFDKEFYIILNVAVGGKFFPDNWINKPHTRPWDWSSNKPMKQFWDAKNQWYPTWDRPEMLVDHILVYKMV